MKNTLGSAALLLIAGCGKGGESPSQGSSDASVVNIMVRDSGGVFCIAQTSEVSKSGIIDCGPQGASTRLEWKRLGRGTVGDRYELRWNLYPDRMPENVPLPATTAKVTEVEFTGKTVVALENDSRSIVLYTGSPNDPPLIDERTPRLDLGTARP